MTEAIIRNTGGFGWGRTEVLRPGSFDPALGIGFSILRLRAGESHMVSSGGETALVLLSGSVSMEAGGLGVEFTRLSLFDGQPGTMHAASGTPMRVVAGAVSELALFEAANKEPFAARAFGPGALTEVEDRGRGVLDDSAHRIVRTIFDWRTRPGSAMMVGEVLTYPGRWSSYPPHHHPQPEIYHYRFTQPQGYGHAELGDEVAKVREGDTLLIADGQDHPQVVAPGYGMYYLWAIWHLPGDPYRVPEFSAEHAWARDPEARFWRPAAIL